ncbi:hypothetical protein PIROE2DRAFT_59607 [Piromyces sp. E2]|nr:hypothetical protein PIROE2DRAFT_59607 [Piromyces sp. E2]|eukprot:OUM66024.1 hypothetical protein PIROE2DRAFT_59607 [Piromyces sp. E2]
MTDNEVPVFRLTLPEDQFSLLKEKANIPDILNFRINVTDYLQRLSISIENLIQSLEQTNYLEKYPEIPLQEQLPELNIGEDGYAKLNIKEIMNGFDFDVKNYYDFDFEHDDILIHVLTSNPNFNIIKLSKIIDLNIGNVDMDPQFKLLFDILLGIGGDDDSESSDFKTKDATLTVEINK